MIVRPEKRPAPYPSLTKLFTDEYESFTHQKFSLCALTFAFTLNLFALS